MKTVEVVHVSPPRLGIFDGAALVAEVTVPADQAKVVGAKLLALGALDELGDTSLAYDPDAVARVVREIFPESD